MTEMFGKAWSPMSVPDLAPDDDDDDAHNYVSRVSLPIITRSVLLPEHIRSILI